MFDWNDEELAILWGEGGESGDHIVPYPEASQDYPNKKDCNQQVAAIKPTEQRTAGARHDLHGRKLESGSDLDTNANNTSVFGTDSWPDLSLSNAAKTDQDSMGTEVSNNLTDISKYKSSRDTARLDNDAEIFQNTHEDREQGDFVDYEWASIGSFDDLDQIFSNDDPIFGHSSLGNADALWSCSKDVANSPEKTFPISVDSSSLESGELRNSSEQLEIKSKYFMHDDGSLPFGHKKFEDASLHDMQNAHAISDPMEYAGNKRKPMVKEQMDMDMVEKTSAATSHLAANVVNTNEFTDKEGSRQTKLLKCQRKSGKNERKTLSHSYGTWSPSRNPSRKFDSQLAPSILHFPPSSMLGQQRQLSRPESLQYGHIANPVVAPYGNVVNPYPAMPVNAQVPPTERKHQPLLSGYNGTPLGASPECKSVNTHVKPLTMTPQEKIKKLRRRQQIQAMLAIQKQQQQFSHQVPNTSNSIAQRCLHESQTQHSEEADLEIEDISTPMDLNSPLEQDDSSAVSVAVDDYSVDRILHKLQNTISKLDMKLRLCIRDSLFRLAQSAMQRHYASDASSNNKNSRDEDEVIAKDAIYSSNSFSGMPDVETVTNPIDRTLAHLLFHSPLESPGKLPDTPESPMSSKLPRYHKVAGLVNLSTGCLPECTKCKQNFPHQESKNPCTLSEPHQLKNIPCTNTTENASNIEPADSGAMEVEASK